MYMLWATHLSLFSRTVGIIARAVAAPPARAIGQRQWPSQVFFTIPWNEKNKVSQRVTPNNEGIISLFSISNRTFNVLFNFPFLVCSIPSIVFKTFIYNFDWLYFYFESHVHLFFRFFNGQIKKKTKLILKRQFLKQILKAKLN